MAIGEIIGIAVLLLSFIISFLTIRKFVKAKTKFLRIVFSILILLVITAIMSSLFISTVSLVCKFDTAERAFHFNHSEEIIEIVDGKSSCMVIYKEQKNTNGIYFLNKSEKGYKLPHSSISKRSGLFVYDNCSISVFKVRGTNDYYIIGDTLSTKTVPSIKNSNGLFVQKKTNQSFDGNIDTDFYDYIDNYETDDYYLTIDDEKIDIKEDIETQKDTFSVFPKIINKRTQTGNTEDGSLH